MQHMATSLCSIFSFLLSRILVLKYVMWNFLFYCLLLSIATSQTLQEDNFIIKFKPGQVSSLVYDSNSGYKYTNPIFDNESKNQDILRIEKMFVDEDGEMGLYYRVWLQNPDPGIGSIIQIFNNIQCVDFAAGDIDGELLGQNHPDDPLYNFSLNDGSGSQEQWYLFNDGDMNDDGIPDGEVRADIHAPEAWSMQTGRSDVILSFSDTGIMWDHPDLADQIWINTLEDGNGNGNFDPQPISSGGDFGDVNGDGYPGVHTVDDDGDGLADYNDIGVKNIYQNETDDDGDGTFKDGEGYSFDDSPGTPGLDDDADVTARFPELRDQDTNNLEWWFADEDNDGWWDIGEPRPCDYETRICDGEVFPIKPGINIILAKGLIKTTEFDNVYIDDYDGAKFDDDENGYVDDVIGWDFKNLDPIPEDTEGHGTAIAGDMIAIGNNDLYTSGVMWSGKIMTTKITNNATGLTRMPEAIYYCAENNANIHNMSWIGSYGNLSAALDHAYNQKNVLLLASVPKEGIDNPTPPSNNQNVIAVAGIDSYDKKHPNSNYGTEIELCAAYSPITILWNDGTVKFFGSGTSLFCTDSFQGWLV